MGWDRGGPLAPASCTEWTVAVEGSWRHSVFLQEKTSPPHLIPTRLGSSIPTVRKGMAGIGSDSPVPSAKEIS